MQFEQAHEFSVPQVVPSAELTAEERVESLRETLTIIEEALVADDFNAADRDEILRNREFFERNYRRLVKAGSGAVSAAGYTFS